MGFFKSLSGSNRHTCVRLSASKSPGRVCVCRKCCHALMWLTKNTAVQPLRAFTVWNCNLLQRVSSCVWKTVDLLYSWMRLSSIKCDCRDQGSFPNLSNHSYLTLTLRGSAKASSCFLWVITKHSITHNNLYHLDTYKNRVSPQNHSWAAPSLWVSVQADCDWVC